MGHVKQKTLNPVSPLILFLMAIKLVSVGICKVIYFFVLGPEKTKDLLPHSGIARSGIKQNYYINMNRLVEMN